MAIVVVGMLIALAFGTLRRFTVTPRGAATVQCDSPVYGSGRSLTGDAAKACDDEAQTRAESAALIALGIGAAGLVLGRIFRSP